MSAASFTVMLLPTIRARLVHDDEVPGEAPPVPETRPL